MAEQDVPEVLVVGNYPSTLICSNNVTYKCSVLHTADMHIGTVHFHVLSNFLLCVVYLC